MIAHLRAREHGLGMRIADDVHVASSLDERVGLMLAEATEVQDECKRTDAIFHAAMSAPHFTRVRV